MAYLIGNITRRNSKQLDIAITDGVSIPKGNEIIFIDSSETADWSTINKPNDLPNATQYFTEVDTVLSTASLYVIRDIPYRVGSHTLFIKHDGTWYKKLNVELTSEALPSPFPGILNRATTKQKSATIKNNDLKGGIKVFTSIYDLLMLEKEEMELGMKCTIWLKKENKIKTYALNPNFPIESIPYPLLDEPYDLQEPRETDARSFRKYWYLDSVAEPELQPIAEIQYAPEYKGGIPPFFEGYIDDTTKSDGYTFPALAKWDEERTFSNTKWSNEIVNVGEDRSKWKRIKESINGNWSRPIRINALSEGYLANRFQRRFEFPKVLNNEGVLVNFKIRTFYKGEANLIAEYTIDDTDYSFEDIPPERRTWEDITGEEREKYIIYYNSSYSTYTGYTALSDSTNIDTLGDLTTPDGEVITARALIEKDNNRLWVVYAEKDDFTNLESTWTEPQRFIENDGALVRYSIEEGDINEVRIEIDKLINSQGGVERDYYNLYEEAGFLDEYNFDTTNYIHTRSAIGDTWISVRVRNESGVYEDIVYKEYPINYYDRLNNTRTKFNYIPVGLNGEKNPQDDIAGNPKDSGFQPKDGYELYFSVSKKLFANQGFITNWSPWIRSSARPAVVDVIEADDTIFKSTIINNQDDSVVERDNTFIKLEAKLFLEQKEIIEGDVYQEANIAEGIQERREEIRYTWKRLFNNGISENLIILDQSPSRLYYGYKSQADFDNYFVNGDEPPQITPSSDNAGFRIGYKEDGILGFIIYDKTAEANTTLRRISLTTGAEGYKRNGILYDANDAVISSNIWVTDDISKLDNPAWADYVAFEFQGTFDYSIETMSWISKGRASYNKEVTFTENGVTETVLPFTFDEEGKIMNIHHAAVDGKAVFEVTQWRKVIDNPDFVAIDENYIPYREEITIRDLVDRVKKGISVLPDTSFLLAKPNFTTYTENEFIGSKSITISRFIENLPNGKWWAWNPDFSFEDAKEGVNAFAGISFDTIMTDVSYWIDLNDAGLSYNVVFNQFIKSSDSTLIPTRTYKFQVEEDGNFFYDFVTLSVNFSGQSAQDMKISPEVFIIPLNEAGDAFDGKTDRTFNVSSENVESPYYEWKLINKAGTVIKTVTGTSGVPQNSLNIDFATDTALGADTAARIAYIKANTPFTLQVKDLVVNKASFIEEATITYIAGGVAGLVGEQGEGGVNVIYNNNDLVASDDEGKVGTVNEDTKIVVYRGIEAQPIGTNSGEFNIILVDARDENGSLIVQAESSLSINGGGVIANVFNSDTIEVTGLPDPPNTINIRFKVAEGNTILKDADELDVIFDYKLKKAKSGVPSWTFDIKDQFIPSVLDSSGNTSPLFSSNARFEIDYEILKGNIPKDVNPNGLRISLVANNSIDYIESIVNASVNWYGHVYPTYQEFRFTNQSSSTKSRISYSGSKFFILIPLTVLRQSFFSTVSFKLRLLDNSNGQDNPLLISNIKISKIKEGTIGNDYFLKLASGSGYLSNQNPQVQLDLKTIINDSSETVSSFVLKINGNTNISFYGASYNSTTKRITINKSSSVLEPILSVELTFNVTRNNNTYSRTVYYTVPNILSQRTIIPVYAGRWDAYTETNITNLLTYLNQGNLTLNDGTYKVSYTTINGLVNNGGQVRRISNNSLITSSISLIDPNISRAYRNDSGIGNKSIQNYNGSLYTITNNQYITFNLSGFPKPAAQSFLIEQEDGTLQLQKWHQIIGEAGVRGRSFRFKTVYIQVDEGTTPTKPGNRTIGNTTTLTGKESSLSGNWGGIVPTPSQGRIIWETSIILELLQDGSYVYAEEEWSKVTRLTGWTGANIIRAYSANNSSLSSTVRQSNSLPANYSLNLSDFNNNSSVYVIEKYNANGEDIKRFNLAGAYSNTGDHFWSQRSLLRKDGSNGTPGRGIAEAKIENNNLKLRYTQSPYNTSFEDLGRVVGNDANATKHTRLPNDFIAELDSGTLYRIKNNSNNLIYSSDYGGLDDIVYLNKSNSLQIFKLTTGFPLSGNLIGIKENAGRTVIRNVSQSNIGINPSESTYSSRSTSSYEVSNPSNYDRLVIITGTIQARRDSGNNELFEQTIRHKSSPFGSETVLAIQRYSANGTNYQLLTLTAYYKIPANATRYFRYNVSSIDSLFIAPSLNPPDISIVLI